MAVFRLIVPLRWSVYDEVGCGGGLVRVPVPPFTFVLCCYVMNLSKSDTVNDKNNVEMEEKQINPGAT